MSHGFFSHGAGYPNFPWKKRKGKKGIIKNPDEHPGFLLRPAFIFSDGKCLP